MSNGAAAIKGASAAQDAVRDWQAVRGDSAIQYAPLPPPREPEVPGWLKALGDFLEAVFGPIGEAIGVSWPVMRWILLSVGIAATLFMLWRLTEPLRERVKRQEEATEEEWTPDRAEALALLDEADRLASEGRFDEATHLLLQRSVRQIAEARPEWVRKASTAREIAALSALPDRARRAFGTIAGRVERSLFALRRLDAADWQAARGAYAEFALEKLPA